MKIKDYERLVFFDTETTGFNGEKNRIIELAAATVVGDEIIRMDRLVKLPEGELVPEGITQITHITDQMLAEDGISEEETAAEFAAHMGGLKTLLIAHNAQFDCNFIGWMFIRLRGKHPEWLKWFMQADYLDTLTVFKDRRAYPHKLANAIDAYGLSDKVQNTHRAIDDVEALLEVTKAMQAERDDLAEYINIFGFNPKYGVSGNRLKKVTYREQRYHDEMMLPEYTLPAIVKRE